ncbi:MAG: tRNA (cytidine(56)-2'-O)-methyltransferase [Candidatus Bathyarchaeia archaeon]|nr:tRNA (cytidine(56)-2'-O)-methyltransferase [Candidatus Bathyarchaeota archaeon]
MCNQYNWRVFVLRLGHRPERDKRVTTHVFLVARAFGAHGAFYSGCRDEKVEASIRRVVEVWGGQFSVEYVENWIRKMREWKRSGGEVIHLTMYGLPLDEVIQEIRNSGKDKLIVVGGEKVPRIVYDIADWNVSITFQPHSEVGALSVFLHELYMGKELKKEFEGAKIKIIPEARGKRIIKTS